MEIIRTITMYSIVALSVSTALFVILGGRKNKYTERIVAGLPYIILLSVAVLILMIASFMMLLNPSIIVNTLATIFTVVPVSYFLGKQIEN